MLKCILFVLVAFTSTSLARPGDGEFSKIELTLGQKLAEGLNADIFVTFAEGTSSVLEAIADSRFPTRDDRLIALHSALVINAEKSQVNVKSVLDQSNKSFEILWITNQIYVRNVDSSLVNQLEQLDEVADITEEEIFSLDDPVPDTPVYKREAPIPEWGIEKIQVEEAYHLLQNATTSVAGIVISTIDTGVRGTHEALKDNYLGDYGWYDPKEKTEFPNDQQGHGTHTTGTIAGKGGIGVYPDAKWIACKGCATSLCASASLLACGQFITCPTLPDGSSPDCTKAPHLVSNSWGGGRGNPWFDRVIAAWHVAGIIPIFSIGNSGPTCGTVGTPADRNVIGVGATTVTDELSSFSSLGPSKYGLLFKPDIAAPGSNVVSAYNTADDAYRALSGTSMACPHVAGLTALLLAYNPDLNFEQVKNYMFVGVERNLLSGNKECDGIKDTVFPNHHFGHGRINAFRSLAGLINFKQP